MKMMPYRNYKFSILIILIALLSIFATGCCTDKFCMSFNMAEAEDRINKDYGVDKPPPGAESSPEYQYRKGRADATIEALKKAWREYEDNREKDNCACDKFEETHKYLMKH